MAAALNRKLKWVAWGIGSLLSLLVLLVALLHTPPARRYALRQIVQILDKQGITFNSSDFGYNLLSAKAELRNVVVRAPQAPDLPAILRADRVQVDIGLRSLLGGKYVIEDGSIRNPSINFVIDENGRNNLPQSPEEQKNETETKVDFLIDKFLIEGGDLRVEDRRQKVAIHLPVQRLTIDGNAATGNHDIQLTASEGGTVSYQTRSLPLRGVQADLLLREKDLDIRNLGLGLGESTITAAGSVKDFDNPRLDLKGDTTLALAPLINFAGVDQNASGTAHIAYAASGTLDKIVARATVEGDNLQLDRFRDVDLRAEAEYDAAASRARLGSFSVTSPSGTVNGKADLALKPEAGQSTANVSARNLNLDTLTAAFKTPVRIASRGTADIAARWPGMEYKRAVADATIRLAATRSAPAKDVVPVTATINAQSSGNRMVVGIQELRALNARATGQVTLVNQKSLAGNINLQAADLAGTISSAEAFLGRRRGTLVGTPVSGRLNVTAKLGGSVDNPAVGASLTGESLSVGELNGINLAAAADYSPARVLLHNADVAWRGQAITASGTVGLKGRAPAIDLVASSENISIQDVLAGLNRADTPVEGTARFNAHVRGTTKQPEVDAQIGATNLVAYKEPLGTLNVQAQLRGDVLTVPELRLNKPQDGGDGLLRAAATYNLESKTYTLDAKSDNLRLTNITLADGRPVRAELNVNAQSQGTAEDPTADVTLRADNVQVGADKFGTVALNAHVENQQARVEATAPAFNLAANATVGMKEPYYASSFEVRANDVDLANLPVKIEQPVTGHVTATVRGSGPLTDFLDKGQATAEIAALDLRYKDQPVQSDGPIAARYENQTLTIDRATLVARDSRVSLQGTLPLDQRGGEGTIQLAAKLDLPSLMQYVPSTQPIVAQGLATIDGTVRGNLKRIDPNIAVTLSNGYFLGTGQKTPVTNANLQALIRNGGLELQTASAQFGVASVSASGTVPFGLLPATLPVELPRRQGSAQFTAELKALNLAELGNLPENIGGTVSARLEATAARPEIEALQARLTFPDLRVNVGSYALAQTGTSEIAVSNGVARVSQFAITGPSTDLRIAGTAGLTGTRPLDLRLDGNFDAAIASVFTDAVQAQGATQLRASIAGTADSPQAQGFVQMTGGQIGVREPQVALDDLNVRVDLAGTRATVSQLSGVLNGGDLSGGGSIDYVGGAIANANVSVKARDVYMNAPEGLKTMSDIDINVRNVGNQVVVGGRVQIADGSYTEDKITRMILAKATQPKPLDLTEQRSALVENIRFDIRVVTQNPIVIDNSLAEAEVNADLRLLGNPYEPGLSGRVTIEEGGELRFQEVTYAVERGVITFTGERTIEPNLDILATTTVGGYDITLRVSGETGRTETTLTSDPALPEPDILALLVTGRTMEEIRGNEFEVASNQVLSYLTGRVGSQLGRSLAGATGLSTVRIEPNLIANEADPSARLTLGQNLTRNLELIYSMDLVNSSDQIYVAEYDLTKRFTTRGVRQADGSFRGDFRHEVRFGGVAGPRRGDRRVERIVGTVNIVGNEQFTDKTLAAKLKAKPGKRYDYFKIRKGLDRIEDLYAKEGMLEAQVRLKREQRENVVDLNLNVNPGPKVDLVFEGIAVPEGLQKDIRESWQTGVFDIQRADDSRRLLRTWLVEEDYLQSNIEYNVTETNGRKRVTFDINAGPKFQDVEIVFDSAQGLKPSKLLDVIDDQKLANDVYVAPTRVTDTLTRLYQEFGYLDAEVKAPKYELNAQSGTGKVIFPVDEGPLYIIRNVAFEGNAVFDDARLAQAAPVPVGEAYKPVLEEHAIQRVRQVYWDQGYNDVDVRMVLQRDKDAGKVDVRFDIAENRQSIVTDVLVQGNRETSENMIRTQLELAPGGVLDLQKLGNSRRNLYNTGAYSLVEIVRDEVDGTTGDETRARQAEGPAKKYVRLRVRVREVQPYEVRYGGFFDTERGPGGIVDVSNRNTLGSARVATLRARYDTQLQELRLSFSQPLLRRFPVKTIASPFFRRERNPATDKSDPFSVDRIGFSIQQEARPWEHYLWNYGYRLERTKTYDAGPNVLAALLVDPPVRIGSLTSTLTRETRDEILDATRGSFMSQAIQFAPAMLGSQRPFAKYFGQYFRYIPLEDEKLELFTNEILRPRLVYAGGVRLGMARGFNGNPVPLSERFFAGGGTTIRGFEQNSLGPTGPNRELLGGEAMLVVNNEIRFPLFSIFDGVGFSDIGNVWNSASDFSFGDLRNTAGVGLRVRTPWFLLRLDYGVKLDRREDEGRGRLFFSIGQAF